MCLLSEASFAIDFANAAVEEAKSAIIVGWRVRSASGARVDGDKSVSGNIMRLNVDRCRREVTA